MTDSKENANVTTDDEPKGFLDRSPVEQQTTGHKLQAARIAVLNAEFDATDDKAAKAQILAELEEYGVRSTADLKKASEQA